MKRMEVWSKCQLSESILFHCTKRNFMDMQKPGPRGRSSSINPGPGATVECKTPGSPGGGCWCLELTDALRPGLRPVLMWLSTEPEALSGCGGTVIFIQDYNFMAVSIREEPTEDTPTVPKCIPIMWQRRMVETVRIEYGYDANCD